MRLLTVTAASFTLALFAIGPTQADDPPPTPEPLATQTVTMPELVDGKDVHWWARRARSRTRRLQAVRSALRGSLGTPGGLARAFLCIHGGEGSWTDSGAPFWGGLQMDYGFQQTYGGEFMRLWGTADHWPAFVQVAVAMRAYVSRGFAPWPATSRACGLR